MLLPWAQTSARNYLCYLGSLLNVFGLGSLIAIKGITLGLPHKIVVGIQGVVCTVMGLIIIDKFPIPAYSLQMML